MAKMREVSRMRKATGVTGCNRKLHMAELVRLRPIWFSFNRRHVLDSQCFIEQVCYKEEMGWLKFEPRPMASFSA